MTSLFTAGNICSIHVPTMYLLSYASSQQCIFSIMYLFNNVPSQQCTFSTMHLLNNVPSQQCTTSTIYHLNNLLSSLAVTHSHRILTETLAFLDFVNLIPLIYCPQISISASERLEPSAKLTLFHMEFLHCLCTNTNSAYWLWHLLGTFKRDASFVNVLDFAQLIHCPRIRPVIWHLRFSP